MMEKMPSLFSRSCKLCVLALSKYQIHGQHLFNSFSKNKFKAVRLTLRLILAKPPKAQ